ncbi:MAG: proline racemase [Candidatus Rokuibacteriota bacterium]|nr:MAG: proline racemase [Candidatus Rokubacteria bacterium]
MPHASAANHASSGVRRRTLMCRASAQCRSNGSMQRSHRRLDLVAATQFHGVHPGGLMRSDRVLTTIDFHTAGIGMRLLTSGLGRVPGATIADKRRWFQEHLDDLRTGLCLEPRGHRGLLIAVMTEAVTPGAEFGLFFIYPGGYYVSCGEGTIGAATVAIETGMVRRQGPETRILVDTEAGPVETIARWEDERVREVTLKWTPSFVALADQVVEVEGVGEVPLDIAVGVGNVFAVVQAPHVGVAIRREHVKRIAQRGMAVRAAVNAQLRVDVPGIGKTSVDNVLVHELPDAHGVSPNALVWGPGQVDAAPCGSGTCARMALFHQRGLMRVGATFVSRGLLGLDFTGRIAGETTVEGQPAILPEITGTSYLTGLSQFLFDPADPVRAGYLLDT